MQRQLCNDNSPIVYLKPKTKSQADFLRADRRRPFSLEEVSLILDAFRTDRFAVFGYKHSFYADLVETMFTLGTRPSELIGLQLTYSPAFRQGILVLGSTSALTLSGLPSKAAVHLSPSVPSFEAVP